ncbi:unannotated protein [freshwater metagenome]|uniref:Unannotated protein n=1 Tax=freshwater metagenome TaxID=449393 RepID=A0A6J7KI20_9ZZZZ|nr:DUF2294 family protein [Actinomycetota bacterium]
MTSEFEIAPDPHAGRAQCISEDMAELYREQFGRTPGTTTTFFPSEDHVLVVLEDSMVPAERRAVQLGNARGVREARLAAQQACAEQFCGIVVAATGREVRAFTSAHDVQADVATEAFVLHPV